MNNPDTEDPAVWATEEAERLNRYKKHYVGHIHPKADKGGYIYKHIFIAEAAIGKHLPDGAEVHHVNELRYDNRNTNLVICQDIGYHKLLHRRTAALDACGNAKIRGETK